MNKSHNFIKQAFHFTYISGILPIRRKNTTNQSMNQELNGP